MLRTTVVMVALAAVGAGVLTGTQPDDGKGKGKKGPPPEKKGPPPWQPGKLIPPPIQDMLELTPDQEKQLHQLEEEVRGRLMKILTDEQKQRIRDIKPKGPPKKGPKDKGPKGPPPDKGDGCGGECGARLDASPLHPRFTAQMQVVMARRDAVL